MRNYTLKNDHDGKYYRRISKAAARKAYNNGVAVVLCPVNLHPFRALYFGGTRKIENDPEYTFDKLVNAATYYNCMNAETGKYLAYYIETEEA